MLRDRGKQWAALLAALVLAGEAASQGIVTRRVTRSRGFRSVPEIRPLRQCAAFASARFYARMYSAPQSTTRLAYNSPR